jgi:hypothetical protein
VVTLTGDGFPTADCEELARFVDALFRYADESGFVQLRAFREDIEGAWKPQQWPAVKLDAVGLEHVAEAAYSFATCCAAAPEKVVFAAPIATFKTSGGAAEKDMRTALLSRSTATRALKRHAKNWKIEVAPFQWTVCQLTVYVLVIAACMSAS